MAAKTVAIVQSCYIPWKGYFDLINRADEFILYDDRQFTRRDWRSRNRIKTPQGVTWLTIPVAVKGKYHQRIDETAVADPEWAQRHWKTLVHAYSAAPAFREYAARIEEMYEEASRESLLSCINRRFIDAVCDVLGIETQRSWSTDYDARGERTARLVSLCEAAGADRYLSGPRAREYLDEAAFESAGIEVEYADYSGYPDYDQLYPPFEHAVTILDLIFHVGRDAPRYLKSFSRVP